MLLLISINFCAMLVEATLKDTKWHDITHFGIRAVLGATFLVHSLKKFDPSWQTWLVETAGLPPEMQLPIALAEFIGGVLLISGVLSRITGVIFSFILLGAIFNIRWEKGFFISEGGWEWDIMMLAVAFTIIAAGPGRISISHLIKKIPRFLQ